MPGIGVLRRCDEFSRGRRRRAVRILILQLRYFGVRRGGRWWWWWCASASIIATAVRTAAATLTVHRRIVVITTGTIAVPPAVPLLRHAAGPHHLSVNGRTRGVDDTAA